MKFFTALFLASALISSVAFSAQTLSKTEALNDLRSFLTQLRTHYGMAKFKDSTFGISFDDLEKKYSRHINLGKSLEGKRVVDDQGNWPLEEIQQLLIGLGAEFRDGHLNIKRNTKDGWTVGLKTADVDGKLIVVGADEDFFVNKNLTQPLNIGDEIIEVNGRPVEDIVKENMIYAQVATYDARRMWAVEHVLEVPSGFLRSKKDGEQVRIKVRKYDSGETVTGFFNWINVKNFNWIRTGYEDFGAKEPSYFFGNTGTTESYFNIGLRHLPLPEGSIMDIGALVNNDITKARKNKTAEVYEKPITRLTVQSVAFGDIRIGIIRIPNYSPDGGFREVFSEVAFLKRAIPYLNQHTDMVILDQVSNNGGYVDYVTEIVKLFAHKQEIPAVTNDIRLTSTYIEAMQSNAVDLAAAGARVDTASQKHPELPNFAQLSMSTLMAERLEVKLKAGEKWTGPLPYMGNVDNINEGEPGLIVAGGNPTYEKKVMILNDRRSASGGDFMPVIMKDARALIVGTTSRGLGGPVYSSIDSLGTVQMFFRCPFGLCEKNGQPFESVGVVPNVERKVTVDDIVHSWGQFANDILNVGVFYYHGATPDKITAFFAKRTSGPAIIGDHAMNVDDKIGELLALAQKGSTHELVTAYKDLLKVIEDNSEKIAPEEWARLQIPVPDALYSDDIILNSIHDRKAVLERLKEMSTLPKFKNNQALHELIKAVAVAIHSTPAEAGVLTSCNFKLYNLRKQKAN